MTTSLLRPMSALLLAAGFASCSDETAEAPAASVQMVFDSTRFEVTDGLAFQELVSPDAEVALLAGEMQFLEGPVWRNEDGGHLIFSDVAANELKRWAASGGVEAFRAPSGPSNGNTLDLRGRLVTAQHDGRITRTEEDGSVVTLVASYMGAQLSSPNDVVVQSDGSIWFTDPTYGLGDRERETPGNYVYRFDPEANELTATITDAEQPNGLCFSPDESVLYLADSGARTIRAFHVGVDGDLSGGEMLVAIEQGSPDGIRCDALGNVWSSAGDGVRVYSSSGGHIGTIRVPESPANLEFGGANGRTLYITARTSLYSVPVLVGDARSR